MSKLEKPEKTDQNEMGPDVITDLDTEAENELRPASSGLRERVRKLLHNMQQGAPGPKQELAKDRTRSLALLIGGTVGAVLLFIGVFSTPSAPPTQQTSPRAAPNLGRGAAPSPPSAPRSSVTPLLNADVRADNGNSDQLSPADIQGTSRRASADDINRSQEMRADTRVSHPPTPPARNFDRAGSFSNAGLDPLAAYRPDNSAGTPTHSYGGPSTAGGELSRSYAYTGAASVPAENRPEVPASAKSSIVFLRSSEPAAASPGTRPAVTNRFQETSLLPPGTRLLARLESAATTAVKMPVVASIEYNYERDGMILVPAGTTVFGDVQQASSQGYLNVRFHTLRMPDGREETIEATGVSLDHQLLKGEVAGKNTGKKLLSQTLSGAGTVAAYVVGAGGAGLSRAVTGETLLRDRLANNVALAGEQELTTAAFAQNVSVTVPANTRFYIVLQKPAVATTPARVAEPAVPSVEMPTVQELRELMDLRREINRMYQESNSTLSRGTKP
jgi:type IV secretory pathway VirB10-like protein